MRAGWTPTEDALHEAAVAHLARYATTRAGLTKVLRRRIDRWIASQPEPPAHSVIAAARGAVLQVVERLAASGAVDDRTFAKSRARRLMRSGHSSRAIAAHLAVRGIDPATRKAALTVEPDQELAAAVKMTARKRIGPFRSAPADETTHRRELGILARAGFDQETARHALGLDHDAAEEVLRRFRQE